MNQEHRELSAAGIWWLPYGLALAGSCEAAVEEADVQLALSTMADHALPPYAHNQVAVAVRNCSCLAFRCLVGSQLKLSAYSGVASQLLHG